MRLRIKLVTLVIVLAPCACAFGADDLARLDRRYDRVLKLDPRMSVRELFRLSLELAGRNHRTDRIEKLLDLAAKMQDLDPDSRTYGNFKWYWGADKCADRNAVEFAMQKAAVTVIRFGERIPPGARKKLDRIMRLSVEGVRRHGVRISYTNIILMKIWNCIALGEILDDKELAELGYRTFDRWLMYTGANGIHEYLSPTYYGVDLENLGLIARYAGRKQARKKAVAALRYCWTDIAANWFTPCARLGGAHSRDYDYLTGRGMLDYMMSKVKWSGVTRTPAFFHTLTHWPPPDELTAPILKQVPRMVLQRWGPEVGQHAAHYVGGNFSIGSAGASYGPMDKPLTINFAGGPGMVMANFFLDARGDPYGKKKFQRASGHSKALHLKCFLTSVQRGSEVLLLASSEPSSDRYIPAPACLLSHLVIPSEPDIRIGGKKAGRDKDITIAMNQPVFLRYKDIAVGVRYVLGLNGAGRTAPLRLVSDGGRYPARRLTCTLSAGKPEGRGTVAVWVRCAEGLDENGFAAFEKQFASEKAKVSVKGGVVDVSAGGMRLRADVDRQRSISRQGGDKGAGEQLLAVNGRDVGLEILSGIDCVRKYRKALAGLSSDTGPSEKTEKVIEAENAACVLPLFEVAADSKASGGKYAIVPNGAGNGGMGLMVFSIEAPRDGDYYLLGRVLAPTSSDDSFYVQVLQGGAEVISSADWHTGAGKQWRAVRLNREKSKTPLAIPLKAGRAQIRIKCREDGTGLDSIMLTTEPAKTLPAPGQQK